MHTTTDYRLAMGGEGPLANTYQDKPHRLVYDLANAVDNLREVIKAGHAELWRLNELCAEGLTDAPAGSIMIAMREALDNLDVTTSKVWQEYLDLENQIHAAKGSPLEQELHAKMEELCKARGWHFQRVDRGQR